MYHFRNAHEPARRCIPRSLHDIRVARVRLGARLIQRRPLPETLGAARGFYEAMNGRRTTRHFSSEPVPREAIELAIRTAGTAPSGAHQQPWTFVAVSDPGLKHQLREAAEDQEHRAVWK